MEEADAGAAADEPMEAVNLEFWSEGAADWAEERIEKYQEMMPSVSIEFVTFKWGEMTPKLMTASAGGAAPPHHPPGPLPHGRLGRTRRRYPARRLRCPVQHQRRRLLPRHLGRRRLGRQSLLHPLQHRRPFHHLEQGYLRRTRSGSRRSPRPHRTGRP